MFLIRKIYDDVLPANREAVREVQRIMRAQFSGTPAANIDKIPEQLRDPMKYRYRTILFIGEDQKKTVKGFALLLHFSDLNFCYLDFISAAPNRTGGTVSKGRARQVGGVLGGPRGQRPAPSPPCPRAGLRRDAGEGGRHPQGNPPDGSVRTNRREIVPGTPTLPQNGLPTAP